MLQALPEARVSQHREDPIQVVSNIRPIAVEACLGLDLKREEQREVPYALVAPVLPFPREALFFALVLYLLGWTLYVLIITLIFYRLLFSPLSAAAMSPLYWINMGAMAITALAGSTLVPEIEQAGMLPQVTPFVTGLTPLAWGTAT